MRTGALLGQATAFAKLAIYHLAPPGQGEFGWLAQELDDVATAFPSPPLKAALDKTRGQPFVPSHEGRRGWSVRADRFLQDIAALLGAALKDSVRQKNMNGRQQVQRLLRLVAEAREELSQPEEEPDRKKGITDRLEREPKRNRAAHQGRLYHGAEASGAYSMLASGQAQASQIYNKFSLSVDPTVAATFGDVVLVFDAHMLQRMGARKMTYLDLIQHGREAGQSKSRLEEDPLRPANKETLIHEQEWVMRVPFPLSPALQEVMVFEEHAEDAEEIAAIIREVSPVPVVIRLMPTHAQSQWSSSTPQDLAMRRATSVLDRHIRPFWWPFYTALTALFDELEAEAPEGWGSAVTEEERAGVRENMGLRARLKTALRAVSGLNSMYGADDADEEALEVLETAFGAAEEAAAGLREKPRSAHLADIIDKMTAGRDPVMQAAREAVREAQMVSRTSQG